MAETRVVPARTPGGQIVALPVVDLDGTAGGGEQLVAGGVPSLAGALAAIEDFSDGFRKAMLAVAPRKATVEFSMTFAVQSGKIVAMFVEGRAEGSVKVTLEWGGTELAGGTAGGGTAGGGTELAGGTADGTAGGTAGGTDLAGGTAGGGTAGGGTAGGTAGGGTAGGGTAGSGRR